MKPLLPLVLLFLSITSFSQEFLLRDTSYIFDCSGSILPDSTNMDSFVNIHTTFCPEPSSNATGTSISFTALSLADGVELSFYDGMNAAAPAIENIDGPIDLTDLTVSSTLGNSSGCLTMVFFSVIGFDNFAVDATLNCTFLECQQIDAAVSAVPLGGNPITVCTGEPVQLLGESNYPENGTNYDQADSTSTFSWLLNNEVFANGAMLDFDTTVPGNYELGFFITDQQGCTSDTIYRNIIVTSPAPFELYNDLGDTLCLGDTINLFMDLDTSVYQYESTFVEDMLIGIPDGTGEIVGTAITVTGFSPGSVLMDVNDLLAICVNIEHSWMRDLEIGLTCPDGTEVILHDFFAPVGGEVFLGIPFEGDDGSPEPIPGIGFDYCWTPDATNGTWLEFSNATMFGALPPDNYNSYEPLENFIGCPLNGDWYLRITDNWAIDNGVLFSWSLEFSDDLDNSNNPDSTTIDYTAWLVDSVFAQDGTDTLTLVPQENTTITFEASNNQGCDFDTTFQLTVLDTNHPFCTGIEAVLSGYVYREIQEPDCEVDFSTEPVAGLILEIAGLGLTAQTDATGYYEFGLATGTYQVQITDLPTDIALCPLDLITAPITLGFGEFSSDNNFYIQDANAQNLVLAVNYSAFEPGGEQNFELNYCNYGATDIDATITFTHDELLLPGTLPSDADSYDYANRTASWSIPNLVAGECDRIEFNLPVASPVPLLAVIEGTASISPFSGDDFPEDNAVSWTQTLVQTGGDTALVRPLRDLFIAPQQALRQQPVVENSIHLVPNPTTGIFELRFNGELTEDYQLRIADVNGRTLPAQIQHWTKEQGQNSIAIYLNAPAGIYWVELIAGQKRYLEKIAIIHN